MERKRGDTLTTQGGKTSLKQLLLLVLLVVVCAVLWLERLPGILQSPAPSPTQRASSSGSDVDRARINSIELVRQSYWEARLKVSYSLPADIKRGYVALYMSDIGWHANVGLITKPGTHSGVVYLSRHVGRPDAYTSRKLFGRIYDPYKNDSSFYKETFDFELSWPSSDTLDIDPQQTYPLVQRVSLYRNIPDYEAFATKLARAGFPAGGIDLNLAVCGGCEPSIIFGSDVSVEALQTVFRILKEHEYKIDRIHYDEDAGEPGWLHIGQTPPGDAKPFWASVDELVEPGISDERFFRLLGYDRESPEQRAIAFHQRAKRLLNADLGPQKRRKARDLLYRALDLNPTYMPIYIELSRYLLAGDTTRYWRSDGNTTEAKQVLQTALRIDDGFADAYIQLGYIRTLEKDYDEARRMFDKAESLGSRSPWLANYQGLWLEKRNELEAALGKYALVLEREKGPDGDTRAWKYAGDRTFEILLLLNEHQRAEDLLATMRKKFPRNLDVMEQQVTFLLIHTERYEETARLVALIDERGCECRERVIALWELVQASQVLRVEKQHGSQLDSAGDTRKESQGDADDEPRNGHKKALVHLLKAQAMETSFEEVIADLSMGDAGRKALGELLSTVLSIEDLESGGISTLMIPVERGSEPAAKFLLQRGADPNALDARTQLTPLMRSVMLGNTSMVRLLLENGGNPAFENGSGVSARSLARQYGRVEISRLFPDSGI